MIKGTLPWYVARSSGIVAWGLLAAAVIFGLLMASKSVRRQINNAWVLDLHRWFAGLALIFTVVHVAAIMLDAYVHFGLADALVPLATKWRPGGVAWGIVATYFLVAVELTSLARRHLRQRWWKRVHFLSFPLFVFATLHGVLAGTDGRKPMAIISVALVSAAVAIFGVIRVKGPRIRPVWL
jgi:DMSO/TMAO reductase YedYZ heme-binding membrane subunit